MTPQPSVVITLTPRSPYLCHLYRSSTDRSQAPREYAEAPVLVIVKAEVSESAAVPADRRDDQPGQPFGILVVDDEEALATLAARSLTSALSGVRIEREVDPRAACRRALDGQFDVIVVDYAMPHMTGHDLITEVRQRRPDQRFIVLSGHDLTTLRDLFVEHRDVPLLSKRSTGFEHLVAHVEKMLDADMAHTGTSRRMPRGLAG